MTPAEIEAYIRRLVNAPPPLNPQQRLGLAALFRPDLPVGIRTDSARAKGNRAA